MKLKSLNLKNQLLNLGAEKLTEILGRDRLSTLKEITHVPINEMTMVELILRRFETQIFSHAILRGYIIHFLKTQYKSYVFKGDPNYSMTESDEVQLLNLAWDRRFYAHHRLIEIFDLSKEYLPSIVELEEKIIEIIPDTKSELINESIIIRFIKKIYNFIKKLFGLKDQVEDSFPSTLFDYQLRVKKNIQANIHKGKKRMIVHMPTGSGKTRTVLEALIELKIKNINNNLFIVWLSHSNELCDQAMETISFLWKRHGSFPITAYRLTGNLSLKLKNKNGGFIVTTYQKISEMRMGDTSDLETLNEIRRNTSTIITDEAHLVSARTFNDSVNFISSIEETTVIGLTASPGKGIYEYENVRIAEFFGQNKISITDDQNNKIEDPISYLQKQEFLAQIKAKRIASNFSLELSEEEQQNILNNFDLRRAIIDSMGKDIQRNLCIIAQLKQLYEQDYSILVFACSLEHSKLLSECCILLDMKVASIDDSTSSHNRKKYIQDFKQKKIKIIVNYGVLSTGFDAPKTNAIFITRPTTSPVLYSQMLGRGLRGPKVEGSETCLLVDIQDNLAGLPDEKVCFTLFEDYYLES